MRQKIENQLHITVPELCKLTEASDIEFYVKQDSLMWTYTPYVISDTDMLVTIPYEDAMKLKLGNIKMQFAYKDASGIPHSSDIVYTTVEAFLKEAGYR